MDVSPQTFVTITVSLHDYIINMLKKYKEHGSLIFLQEAQKGNEAYRELVGVDNRVWIEHLHSKGVPLQ